MKVRFQEEEVIRLLDKYINNQCSEQEVWTLLQWLKSSDCQKDFDHVCASEWEQALSGSSYPTLEREKQLRQEAFSLLQQMDMGKKKPTHVTRAKIVWRIGKAVAAACLLIGMGLFFYKDVDWKLPFSPSNMQVMQEYVAETGEIKKIQLQDGTSVILNSGSRLRVANDFNRNARLVELDGEGFFHVMPNKEKPFWVDAKDVRVKVTGTSFNVNAYDEDNDIAVTVATGKVLVGMEEQQMQLQLLPNEHLAIDRQGGNIHKDVLKENNYMKWMDGYLYFDKLPIRQVVRMITRKYNQQIELDCKNSGCLISGIHDNKSLQSVLDAVCFAAGLKQRKEKDRIILYE